MKIIILKDKIITSLLEEVKEIIDSLREDYNLEVDINDLELTVILSKLYDYYASKEILYEFREYMIGHFEDIAITAIENNAKVDIDFILNGIKLYELLDSRVEVNPNETKKIISKIRKIIKKGKKQI